MAERNPVSWVQAGSHSAENDRLTAGGRLGQEGVSDASSMKVTAPGGLNVAIAAGWASVLGTNSGSQGKYDMYNDSSVTKSVTTQDATLNRIDKVVAEVVDAAYVGGIVSAWDLRVIAGSPNASPVAPATPNNALVLATVLVLSTSNGGGAVSAGNITDGRKYAESIGGARVGLSTDTITPTRPGMRRFDTDKNQTQERNAADSAWLPKGNTFVAALASAPTPTFTGAMLIDPATGISYWYDGTTWQAFGQSARGYTFLQETVLLADGVLSVQSIPQAFDHLMIVGMVRQNVAEAFNTTWLRMGFANVLNTGGTDYDYQIGYASLGTPAASGAQGASGGVTGFSPGTTNANVWASVRIEIPYYRDTSRYKQAITQQAATNSGSDVAAYGGVQCRNTAAFNRLDMGSGATAMANTSFKTGSFLRVFGAR